MIGHRCTWILAGLLLCTPLGARSDEPGDAGAVAVPTIPPEEDREARPGGVEAITVTAEKREADIQDTAISITAFSGDDLTEMGIGQTGDIAKFTPGLQINQFASPSHTQAFIRGIGEGDFHVAVQSRVAYYIDGVYLGAQTGAAQNLVDMERIEVLRGPQGTLYGRNTIGGLINIVTEKPTPEFGAKLQAAVGSYDLVDAKGYINFPLFHESLAARIGFSRTYHEPYEKNRNPLGRDNQYNANRWGVRAAVRWTPTDTWTWDYSFDHTSHDEGAKPSRLTATVPSLGGVPTLPYCTLQACASPFLPPIPFFPGLPQELESLKAPERGDDRLNNGSVMQSGEHPRFRVRVYFHSLTGTWDVNETLQIKAISGWRKLHNAGAADLDGVAQYLIDGWSHTKHDQFSQELQAVGTLFDGKLDYAFGATWFNDWYEHRTVNYIMTGCVVTLGCGLGTSTAVSAGPANMKGEGWAWGVFSQMSYHITDKLTLTGGIRYTYERKDVTYPVTSAFPVEFNGDNRFDAWTPMARLEYHLTDDILTYLGWSRGYKSGGFDQRPSPAATLTGGFNEENLYAWEAGTKTQWLDNRLQLNVSGYYYDWDDRQVQIFDPITFTGVIQNAGKSRVRGFEVEMRTAPVAGLDIRLGHSWNYIDITEWMDLNPQTGQPINRARMKTCIQPGNALCPVQFSGAPTRQFSGHASYAFPSFDWGDLVISGSFVRVGATEWDQDVQPETSSVGSPHYTVYDARIQLNNAFGRDGLWLAVVGENLGDNVYEDYGGAFADSLGVIWNQYGPPQRFKFEFGLTLGAAD